MGRGKLCLFGGGDTPAEGLRVEQPPCDLPLSVLQPAAPQCRGSAAPLAAAAPAQQPQGAVQGEDQAVPGSSEVAGTWWDDGHVGMGVALAEGLSAPFLSSRKQGKPCWLSRG